MLEPVNSNNSGLRWTCSPEQESSRERRGAWGGSLDWVLNSHWNTWSPVCGTIWGGCGALRGWAFESSPVVPFPSTSCPVGGRLFALQCHPFVGSLRLYGVRWSLSATFATKSHKEFLPFQLSSLVFVTTTRTLKDAGRLSGGRKDQNRSETQNHSPEVQGLPKLGIHRQALLSLPCLISSAHTM